MTHDHVVVIVEIPQGSRNKYEYDAELGAFRLDRMLFSSVHYPADYGYVKDTLAEDGDPLDAMVLVDEPTFPGGAPEDAGRERAGHEDTHRPCHRPALATS
jgi:inorganic pyrophosphatase